jgi:hypothetical protein
MINRNELLVAARAEFLRAYLEAFDQFLPQSIEDAFKKADTSRTSIDQSRYLTVRGILRGGSAELREQLHHSMDKLLNRSLQTTYNPERPALAAFANTAGLSLVDTSTYEDELQLVAFTDRLRNEAAEQLRDLNIRIALLFGQDDIKERENPFRPYLVTRSLVDAAESLGLPKELSNVLTQLLADGMENRIDSIYAVVNAFLAQNGLAAELPLRIRKSPLKTPPVNPSSSQENAVNNPDAAANAISEPSLSSGNSAQPGAGSAAGPGSADASGLGQSVDQFLQTIKAMVETANQNAAQVAAYPPASAAAGMSGQIGNTLPTATHEQKVDQLLGLVKRYSESVPGAGFAAGGGQRQTGGMQQAGGGQAMPAGSSAAASSGASAPVRSGWLSGVQKVGDVLRKLFVGSGAQAGYAAPPAPRTLTVQLSQSIDRLLQEHTPATADMLGGNGEVRNLILEQRSGLSEQTREADEQMTIDVVAMLFEFILRDHRVPAEVRAQLGRLQFLMLKLALRDPTFLTQKGHPARMLINRIGSISVGLKQIDPGSERVGAEICMIVETLLNDAAKRPDQFSTLFAKLLDDFDEFVAAELRGKDDKLNRAVQAIEDVQSRTLRFTHISAQMAETLSGLTLDAYLHDFLTNVWVQVIERAECSDMARARRYRELVPDLIWSIAPKVDEYDREEMSAILPIMISTLRQGLVSIAWPQAQQQELLGWLFDAHNRALHSVIVEFQVPSLPMMHTNFERLVENVAVAHPPVEPETHHAAERALMDTMLRELNTDLESLDQYFDREEHGETDTGSAAGSERADDAVHVAIDESIVERLHSGIYIEIKLSQKPSRARLSWISADASNLILSLDDQRAPSLMSLRVFQRLLANGRVRFIEDQPLFERAVQSLLDSAEEMDKVESVAA